MPDTRLALLRWQFDLTWSLFEYHLDRLTAEDFRWEPVPHCWTLRPTPDGGWAPDWADTEPDPVPVPTVAWLTWHIGWWWGVTQDHLRRRPPRGRTEVGWPGDGAPAVAWLRDLRGQWLALLDGLTDADLDAPAPFPWPEPTDLTVAHTLAWVTAELMKNAAEIGQLRLVRAAR
ncbi:DinB family protein [Micromonospora fluostatini]|uniref:DinB family protein n=1 Tax=Micromonospora sp. JCM 30529 TaxID=3421643 RepID=UPI003D16AA2E